MIPLNQKFVRLNNTSRKSEARNTGDERTDTDGWVQYLMQPLERTA